MKSNVDSNFWPSYSDLLTTLFFVMLILFVLSFSLFEKSKQEIKEKRDSLQVKVEQYEKVQEIQKAISKLDTSYFYFNKECRRHELIQNLIFYPGRPEIPDTPVVAREELLNAGKILKKLIDSLSTEEKIRYILILEGRVAKKWDGTLQLSDEDARFLSYRRGLSIYKFWIEEGLKFDENLCEVIISGSGYDGNCRYNDKDEGLNKRVVIHILPKIGIMGQNK